MLFTRRAATVAVLTVLASPGPARRRLAGPRPARGGRAQAASACGRPGRATGRAPSRNRRQAARGTRPPPGTCSATPTAARASRSPSATGSSHTIKSTWGGPRYPLGPAAAGQRQDPDRHVDLRRLGDRPGPVRGAQARCERPGARGQGPQQGATGRGSGCASISPSSLLPPGHPETTSRWSFARTCRAPAGAGAAPPTRSTSCSPTSAPRTCRSITVQSSMNLTRDGATRASGTTRPPPGEAASTARSAGSSAESRRDRPVVPPVPPLRIHRQGRRASSSPAPAPPPATTRSCGHCGRCAAPGTTLRGDSEHRTQIRIIQYAIYDTRGTWIAKRLQRLWNAGCNIKIIYSVMQPCGPRHPAVHGGPRSDPDATVRDPQRVRRDREVQPQQVDDHHRALGGLHAALRWSSRVRPTGETWPSPPTSRCSRSPATATPGRYLAAFARTWKPAVLAQARPSGGVLVRAGCCRAADWRRELIPTSRCSARASTSTCRRTDDAPSRPRSAHSTGSRNS